MRYMPEEMAKMGRPPKADRAEVRSRVLPVIRVTEEEADEIRAAAKIDGKKLAAWVRETLLAKARRIMSRK